MKAWFRQYRNFVLTACMALFHSACVPQDFFLDILAPELDEGFDVGETINAEARVYNQFDETYNDESNFAWATSTNGGMDANGNNPAGQNSPTLPFLATPEGFHTISVSATSRYFRVFDLMQSVTIRVGSASISGRLWCDLNQNGIEEAGEPGIAGSDVFLRLGSNLLLVETDANGIYQFDHLPAGMGYVVDFGADPFLDKSFSPQDVGADDTIDSDVDATGKSAPINLTSGQMVGNLDAGAFTVLLGEVVVGGFVWDDLNGNGIQDGGELGLQDVGFTLFKSDGTPVASTSTSANGVYSIANVPSGDYYVGIMVPSGYALTTPNIGSNDLIDSDFDDTTGQSPFFTAPSTPATIQFDAGLVFAVGG